MARTHAAASSAPAAPSRWPCTDLVELTGSRPACSPKTRSIARVSATSPSRVDVPWASTQPTSSRAHAGLLQRRPHRALRARAVGLRRGDVVAVRAGPAHDVLEPVDGGIHLAVRFSGIEVGTVGGGTGLPHAQAFLSLLRCTGPGSAHRLAQVIAAAALCLELSASASASLRGSENFATAHATSSGRG